MIFADMKNDFVFRRIFATHPDLLCRLLNDLLERTGDQLIETIEYLPSEQLPVVEGSKLSILDVRCTDRARTTFVVEMQLVHHPGFVNRVVYNACKAYSRPMKKGEWYTSLLDVMAISICDFELWPDAQQSAGGRPPVPMLSRWILTERASKNEGLPQVQYAFLELPKLPEKRPETAGADLWAWLFVHATELTEVPNDLSPGPYRDALELANQAKFTQEELNTYERVRDEIRQVLEIANERWAQGKAEGKAESILTVLAVRGITVDEATRARITGCLDEATLEKWLRVALSASSAQDVVNSS